VLAYGVARRTREIGIRLAVGARPATIERMILFESLAIVAAGIAIGVPCGIGLASLGGSLLFGLSAHDPLSLALAIGALTLTSLIATLLPARRAARVDPALVLRGE
jgi:putative ABC transport system permease protein